MLRVYNGRILGGQGGELWCAEGKIVPPVDKAVESLDARGLIVAPGYIDAQINGAYGVDFTLRPEGVGEVARRLVAHGVTSFVPTVVSSLRLEYRRLVRMLQPRQVAGGASILGVHLEGPFIAKERRGAHVAECVVEGGDVEEFYGVLAGVRMVTLAPELPGMLKGIEKLREKKVAVCLGHSSASLDVALDAVGAGARGVTHLFNAMPPFNHRRPGLIDAALLEPGMSYTLICDGVHLDEQAVRMAWRLNPEGLVLVSDAMEGMGLPDGSYHLGGQKVEIRRRRAVVAQSEVLAGSVAPLDECVRILRVVTGCSLEEAVDAATRRPAELLGLYGKKGTLDVGADADFVFLDNALQVQATFVGGQRVF